MGISLKTSLYIYIFQDEKCRLMSNLSLSMDLMELKLSFNGIWMESISWVLMDLKELMSWNLFIFIESKKFGFSGFY